MQTLMQAVSYQMEPIRIETISKRELETIHFIRNLVNNEDIKAQLLEIRRQKCLSSS